MGYDIPSDHHAASLTEADKDRIREKLPPVFRFSSEGITPADNWTHTSGLKDSGTRRSFDTGAQRDAVQGKGRFDLTSYFPLKRYAQHMEKGSVKYAARNWEKGMPLSVFLNSLENHLHKLKAGFTDEDHAAAVIWNIAGFIETEERIKRGILPKELDDLPHTYAGQEPGF